METCQPPWSLIPYNKSLSLSLCVYIYIYIHTHTCIFMFPYIYMDFPGGSNGKEPACKVGDLSLIPRLGRSPGEGNSHPLQYSCLENSMDRGAWQAIVYRVAKSQTRPSHFHFLYVYIYLYFFLLGFWGTLIQRAPEDFSALIRSGKQILTTFHC